MFIPYLSTKVCCVSHSVRAEAVGEAIVQLLQEDTGKKYIDEGADLVETLKRR